MTKIVIAILFIVFTLANLFALEKFCNSFTDRGWFFVLKLLIMFAWFIVYLLIIKKLKDLGIDIPFE